jgi:hypothetical protein
MAKIVSERFNPISTDTQTPKVEETKLAPETKTNASEAPNNEQAQQKAGIQLAADRMGQGQMQQQVLQQELSAGVKQAPTDSLEPLENALVAFDQSHQEVVSTFKELGVTYEEFAAAASRVTKLISENSSPIDLLDATKNMQETQMSFNLQYLQLQNQMQDENRRFTLVSNIMKTKHDTVKNSISNVR